MMGNAMVSAVIAAAIVLAIGYGLITHLQNRGRRSRAAARSDGGSSAGLNGYVAPDSGFSLGSWFSSDSSGSSIGGGSCSSGDSGSGGGDCGGGGDGGGGGGGD